jgi:hypothetical protein
LIVFKANPIIAAQKALSLHLHAEPDVTSQDRPRIEVKRGPLYCGKR